MLTQAKGPDLFRAEYLHWRQAGSVELAHGPLVDGAYAMQRLHGFMDGCDSITAVFLGHHLSPPAAMAKQKDGLLYATSPTDQPASRLRKCLRPTHASASHRG